MYYQYSQIKNISTYTDSYSDPITLLQTLLLVATTSRKLDYVLVLDIMYLRYNEVKMTTSPLTPIIRCFGMTP